MVTSSHERLHVTFANALSSAGFSSWIGEARDSTKWLAKKFGDVYLHETAIAHIRRLLGAQFVCEALQESPSQFKQRMRKVEDFMNSDDFAAAHGGRGLLGLAKDLHKRCEAVIQLKGERIPK